MRYILRPRPDPADPDYRMIIGVFVEFDKHVQLAGELRLSAQEYGVFATALMVGLQRANWEQLLVQGSQFPLASEALKALDGVTLQIDDYQQHERPGRPQ